VWDDRGVKYLDAHTGHGVAFLGHQNPYIIERLKAQIEELMVCSLTFHCRVQDEAIDALERVAPTDLNVVAFTSTGSEAVELALKTAWAYTRRRRVVALKGSFHGRTLGALSVTWAPRHRQGFPVLNDIVWVDPRLDPAEAHSLVPGDAAAIIVEPVLGEGGVIPVDPELLKALREAAEERGALFIADEVQTGFGRCGTTWLSDEYGLRPDMLVAGKAIGGGYPVAAVFMGEELARAIEGKHGSTYAGNPLALAAVSAASRVLVEDSVPAKARDKGLKLITRLRSSLRGVEHVREVRGLGLMVGVELRHNPQPVLKCLQDRGRLLALKAGATVVRLLPPYTIGEADIEWAVKAIESCISTHRSS
jgi:acetylornithine/LysW-gamma-L-lysine aminotransferase